jgi:hypothetical protein
MDAIGVTDASPSDAQGMDALPGDAHRADASSADVAHYCAVNNEIAVGTTNVPIRAATMQPITSGAPSPVSCIDMPPMAFSFNAAMFIRGCINVIGSAAGEPEYGVLDVAIFNAKTSSGAFVDPSFDPVTGADRSPSQRHAVGFSVDNNVSVSSCASGHQLNIGFGVALSDALQSQTDYIVRVRTRTSTQSLTGTWATTYYYGIRAANDEIIFEGIPSLNGCDAQKCHLQHNINLYRGGELTQLVQGAATPVPGSSNLSDGMGAGYAAIETYDCTDRPMKNAVAGTVPTPLNQGYVTMGAFSAAATASSEDGIFFALGFMGQTQSDTMPITLTGATGINRGSGCTEEFGGQTAQVFPDAITVLRSGKNTVLHMAQ